MEIVNFSLHVKRCSILFVIVLGFVACDNSGATVIRNEKKENEEKKDEEKKDEEKKDEEKKDEEKKDEEKKDEEKKKLDKEKIIINVRKVAYMMFAGGDHTALTKIKQLLVKVEEGDTLSTEEDDQYKNLVLLAEVIELFDEYQIEYNSSNIQDNINAHESIEERIKGLNVGDVKSIEVFKLCTKKTGKAFEDLIQSISVSDNIFRYDGDLGKEKTKDKGGKDTWLNLRKDPRVTSHVKDLLTSNFYLLNSGKLYCYSVKKGNDETLVEI